MSNKTVAKCIWTKRRMTWFQQVKDWDETPNKSIHQHYNYINVKYTRPSISLEKIAYLSEPINKKIAIFEGIMKAKSKHELYNFR